MNLKGYIFLTVNFSGSWSYGKDYHERLAGNVGYLDVKEIMAIITELQENEELTKTDLHFLGGSYSGLNGIALFQ